MARRIQAWLVIGLVLGAVFVLPRALVAWRGSEDPWTSYFYQYGLGLLTFLVGIGVILRSGACRPGRGRDGFWLGVLFAGFCFFAALHAVWIVAARSLPYLGGD